MKTRLFKLIIKLMYRNLSKGEYQCPHCIEAAGKIMEKIEKRERVIIVLNPDFNASGYFMSYHISAGRSAYEQVKYYYDHVIKQQLEDEHRKQSQEDLSSK